MLRVIFLVTALLLETPLFGQGAVIVDPISKAVYDKSETVNWSVYNRLDQPLKVKITPHCLVDGRELKEKDCDAFFRLEDSGVASEKLIEIPANQKHQLLVRSIGKIEKYGLYKPIFDPVLTDQPVASGVKFVFNYQPGALFLLNPSFEKLELPKATKAKGLKHSAIMFEFDLKHLANPQVVNISAKVFEKNSKKVVKLLRLANEKIVDPTRNPLNLEVVWGELNDQREVCYELIIQNQSFKKDIYTMSGCPSVGSDI
jgi:hypothetical protein